MGCLYHWPLQRTHTLSSAFFVSLISLFFLQRMFHLSCSWTVLGSALGLGHYVIRIGAHCMASVRSWSMIRKLLSLWLWNWENQPIEVFEIMSLNSLLWCLVPFANLPNYIEMLWTHGHSGVPDPKCAQLCISGNWKGNGYARALQSPSFPPR